jgi:hypothetical protein
MIDCGRFGAVAIAAVLLIAAPSARAQDATNTAQDLARYPDFRGQWARPGSAQWDPTKPGGLKQEAPLTPEYQAILEASVKEIATGGQQYNKQATCLPAGMPRMMIAYEPLEFIVTPPVTYIRSDHLTEFRRIYTDGRDWPKVLRPAFTGTSIGKWIDQDGDGRYDVLEVETRGLKGPRNFDATGIPFHPDNQTVIKERIYLDPANKNILHDEVTTSDHALTRPWAVKRSYKREPQPYWLEVPCGEANSYISINGESYYLAPDGLMPTRKDQPPPDLRHFSAQR